VVERLRRSGAIIVGKTNLDEFAMGSTTATSYFGPTRNPLDPERTPGGSSGGSAAAVGICDAALGSDTGGSIRQPASFCGLTGFKPSYGHVSRSGLVAFASSLDQIGPLGQTARDAALIYDAIKGRDERDATSLAIDMAPTALEGLELAGLRLGVPAAFFADGLAPDVAARVREALDLLEQQGAALVPLELPHLRYAVAVYYIIAPAEASANLARFDGVRYGYRAECRDLSELYLKTRSEGFGSEVRRRIMLGTYALSSGYYDQYFRRAAQVRTLIRQDFARAFERCDLIAGPTTPSTAFKLSEIPDDPLKLYLQDIFTIPANLAGLPAISLPCGFDAQGLPVGLQLMGPAGADERVLRAAMSYQDLTDFHLRRPACKS
jgi:aspartyl-tRNA(Asn)/glutamyl-tRNA(Gln) amidotransferase subunit A